MKFNISLKVLPLLACGMLMASCNDFLKQEPLTDITPTDYYKDATQLQAVANAFYQTVLPEMSEVANIIKNATSKSLLILDEIVPFVFSCSSFSLASCELASARAV